RWVIGRVPIAKTISLLMFAAANSALVLRWSTRAFSTAIDPDIDCGNSRSEEHTSELQSHLNLVCRLLLEQKNIRQKRWFRLPLERVRENVKHLEDTMERFYRAERLKLTQTRQMILALCAALQPFRTWKMS